MLITVNALTQLLTLMHCAVMYIHSPRTRPAFAETLKLTATLSAVMLTDTAKLLLANAEIQLLILMTSAVQFPHIRILHNASASMTANSLTTNAVLLPLSRTLTNVTVTINSRLILAVTEMSTRPTRDVLVMKMFQSYSVGRMIAVINILKILSASANMVTGIVLSVVLQKSIRSRMNVNAKTLHSSTQINAVASKNSRQDKNANAEIQLNSTLFSAVIMMSTKHSMFVSAETTRYSLSVSAAKKTSSRLISDVFARILSPLIHAVIILTSKIKKNANVSSKSTVPIQWTAASNQNGLMIQNVSAESNAVHLKMETTVVTLQDLQLVSNIAIVKKLKYQ
mmetsp:Transcript_34377/g.40165  ORF Transcript_34377/g.40165 Transcript_34377/m.40165 type:complete len:339 (-) Transcript_34377:210-1226(-)